MAGSCQSLPARPGVAGGLRFQVHRTTTLVEGADATGTAGSTDSSGSLAGMPRCALAVAAQASGICAFGAPVAHAPNPIPEVVVRTERHCGGLPCLTKLSLRQVLWQRPGHIPCLFRVQCTHDRALRNPSCRAIAQLECLRPWRSSGMSLMRRMEYCRAGAGMLLLPGLTPNCRLRSAG